MLKGEILSFFGRILSEKYGESTHFLFNVLFTSSLQIQRVFSFFFYLIKYFQKFRFIDHALRESDFVRAVELIREILNIEKINANYGLLEISMLYGRLLMRVQQYNQSEDLALELIKISKSRNKPLFYAFGNLLLGETYLRRGKTIRAYSCFSKAYSVYRALNVIDGVYRVIYNFGQLFYGQDNYDNAIRYFKKALLYNKRNYRKYYQILDDIAAGYIAKGSYIKAKKYLDVVIKRSKFLKPTDLAYVFYDLGELNLCVGDLDGAKNAITRCIALAERSKNRPLIAATYGLYAQLMEIMGHMNDAITFCKKSLALQQEIENKEIIIDTLTNCVLFHIKCWRKNEALNYLEQLEKLAEEMHNKSYLAVCKILHAELNLQEGNYDAAENLLKEPVKFFENKEDLQMFWYSKLVLADVLVSQSKIVSAEKEIKDVINSAQKHNAIIPLIRSYLVLGALASHKTNFENAKATVKKAMTVAQKCGFIKYFDESIKLLEKIKILETAWEGYTKVEHSPMQREKFYIQSLDLVKSYIVKAKQIISLLE